MAIEFPQTQEEHARILANHMPSGYAWDNKHLPDSTLGKFILALSVEFYELEVLLGNFTVEMDVNQTSQLLPEWEKSVGIPDPCFGRAEDLTERRRDVLYKLNNYLGVQTLQDFLRILDIFGVAGTIANGNASGVFPLKFPIRFFGSKEEATHTIIVDFNQKREVFELPYPLPFTSSVNDVIICVLRSLRPANVQIIFTFSGTT